MTDDWRLDGGVGNEVAGVRVARLVSADVTAGPLVECGGAGTAPVAARSTVALTPADAGRSALVVFEDGDVRRPIIVGLLQEPAVTSSAHGPAAAGTGSDAAGPAEQQAVVAATAAPRSARRDVHIDGEHVSLDAKQELVLRCGEASVTLRADGRIVIKGMEIVSRARGTHKVKGASVLIN
jgi:uncharacterized protein involved in type VI secretion and phage assembly